MTGPASTATGRAIAAVCFGIFCLATLDAAAKWLVAEHSVAQIVFLRMAVTAPAAVVLAWTMGGLHLLKPQRVGMHLLRGVFGTCSATFFFAALRYLPLATVWTIAFSAPLIMTALSRPFLGEPVGARRWVAVLAGFAGVLVVVQPGASGISSLGLTYAILGTLAYSLLQLTARKYAASETTPAMVLFNALVPVVLAGAAMPVLWTTPTAGGWLAFAVLGVFSAGAVTFLTLGYRLAPPAVVAPFDYTALVWSVLWGWVIWRDWPEPATWAGAAIIVASGLYIIRREARGGV